ncbi:MAG TPA: hypothetical protein VK668_17095 [Mucilaginibacter sp.]|nr:hypothetical protein [Mucilaginibacter sp.]
MKKVRLSFLLLSLAFVAQAQGAKSQTPPLNKQQTLDYITKLWQANFPKETDAKWTIVLEGKILVKKSNSSNTYRTDLSAISVDSLIIKPYGEEGKSFAVKEVNSKMPIFWAIEIESDATRLKKALIHLIELVKAEKSTDPFDN